MKFADGLVKAYNTKWSYVNSFKVQIMFSNMIASSIGWDNETDNGVNLNVVSLSTPQFSNQSIEQFVGDRWKIHVGRDELFRFSMTFRDQDQMMYYRKFVLAYFYQERHYFDDIKMQVHIWKEADYYTESDQSLFELNDVLIESISQLQFNTSAEAEIAEFTVDFRCASPLLKYRG